MNTIKKLSLLTVLFLGMSLHSKDANQDSTASLIAKGIMYGSFTGLISNAVVTAAGGFPIQIIVWPAAYMLRTALGEKSTKNFQDQDITNNTSFLASWVAYFLPLPIK